jgi:hypothetical protein
MIGIYIRCTCILVFGSAAWGLVGSALGTRFQELIVGRWGVFFHIRIRLGGISIGIALYFC